MDDIAENRNRDLSQENSSTTTHFLLGNKCDLIEERKNHE